MNGAYRGQEGTIEKINEERFSCVVTLNSVSTDLTFHLENIINNCCSGNSHHKWTLMLWKERGNGTKKMSEFQHVSQLMFFWGYYYI